MLEFRVLALFFNISQVDILVPETKGVLPLLLNLACGGAFGASSLTGLADRQNSSANQENRS